MNEQTKLVDRGACWKQTDKNGKPYLSGQIKEDDGTIRRILIFQNTKRDNPKSPDYRIKEQVPDTEPLPDDSTDGNYGPDEGDIPF